MDDETRKKMNVEETFAAIDKIIGRLEKGDGSLKNVPVHHVQKIHWQAMKCSFAKKFTEKEFRGMSEK